MIDLHTHTTASDGLRTPADLVGCAAAAGVSVLAVTDHDTVAGCAAAAAAAFDARIELVPGIEITSMHERVDVHVLGYFIDVTAPSLLAFLAEQRTRRLDRLRQMIDRLIASGIVLNADAVLGPAIRDSSRAAGRPWIARALVEQGAVRDTREAFDVWLARGRPAYVPRLAAPPDEVCRRIHEAGGVASLAHPGLLGRDGWIPAFADAGLDAIEAYYPEHDEGQTGAYVALAERLGLAVSGGSDYHGDASHGATSPGVVALPRDAFERLAARKP